MTKKRWSKWNSKTGARYTEWEPAEETAEPLPNDKDLQEKQAAQQEADAAALDKALNRALEEQDEIRKLTSPGSESGANQKD